MTHRLRRSALAGVLVLLCTLPVLAAAAAVEPVTGPSGGRWPLSPVPLVTAGFDPPVARWGAGHRGVDLAGEPGQRVSAALGGTIRFAAPIAGRGVVVVDHGGRRTTYQPVAASVQVGDVVGAGATIGRLQLFGSHCLPASCLHWGLVVGGEYRDPLGLVGLTPVRLLPLSRPGPLRRSAEPTASLPPVLPAQLLPAPAAWPQARGWAWR